VRERGAACSSSVCGAVSSSVCEYQAWQLKLLYWSMKKSKQKGKLVILLSEDKGHQGENPDFTFPKDVTIIRLPDWAHEWQVIHDDWWGGIPNKYKAVEWLVSNNYFKDEDKLLFLDPDMVFINPIDTDIQDNQVIGQKFIHFTHLTDCSRNVTCTFLLGILIHSLPLVLSLLLLRPILPLLLRLPLCSSYTYMPLLYVYVSVCGYYAHTDTNIYTHTHTYTHTSKQG
jgi:hypothetical protein